MNEWEYIEVIKVLVSLSFDLFEDELGLLILALQIGQVSVLFYLIDQADDVQNLFEIPTWVLLERFQRLMSAWRFETRVSLPLSPLGISLDIDLILQL